MQKHSDVQTAAVQIKNASMEQNCLQFVATETSEPRVCQKPQPDVRSKGDHRLGTEFNRGSSFKAIQKSKSKKSQQVPWYMDSKSRPNETSIYGYWNVPFCRNHRRLWQPKFGLKIHKYQDQIQESMQPSHGYWLPESGE